MGRGRRGEPKAAADLSDDIKRTVQQAAKRPLVNSAKEAAAVLRQVGSESV